MPVYDPLFYLIGSFATLMIMASVLPDLVAAVRAGRIEGATWVTPLCSLIGVSTALVVDVWSGNLPFFVLHLFCVGADSTVLWFRFKKR